MKCTPKTKKIRKTNKKWLALKKKPLSCNQGKIILSTKDKDILAVDRSMAPLPTMAASLSLEGFPPEASAIMTTDAQNFTSGMLGGMGTPGGMDLFGIRGASVSPAAYSTTTAYYGLDPIQHMF